MEFRRIVVAISGGVDSAICAYLLKKKGFEVSGAFMKNWDEYDEKGLCSGEKDWKDANLVCKKLDIPLVQVNFVKEYWNSVFSNFLDDYQNGFTPNPDILCNRHIKFNKFFHYAREKMNADAIATGHYARTSFGPFLEKYDKETEVRLLQPKDKFKDQTFFLSEVNQNALRRTMFPLSDYIKSEVKEMAQKIGLAEIAAKKESTGICFIGHRHFQDFIQEYLDSKPGNFIDVDTGKVIGTHKGIHNWTIGQGCKIHSCLKPYFVAFKDIESNTIFVAAGTDHPCLYSNVVYTMKPSWIRNIPMGKELRCKFRFQHTKPLVDCLVKNCDGQGLEIELSTPLRALTPGQYAVLYYEEECLGSAKIISSENGLIFKEQLLKCR